MKEYQYSVIEKRFLHSKNIKNNSFPLGNFYIQFSLITTTRVKFYKFILIYSKVFLEN